MIWYGVPPPTVTLRALRGALNGTYASGGRTRHMELDNASATGDRPEYANRLKHFEKALGRAGLEQV